MSKRKDTSFRDVEEGLQAVEAFWRLRLPPSFRSLYAGGLQGFFAPCEFFSVEELAEGAGRAFGQVPQFFPFGRVAGEESLYGFYFAAQSLDDSPPILYWDEGETFLRPVSSSFETFLRRSIVTGRYETEDEWPGSADPGEAQFRLVSAFLDFPETLFLDSLPRNDTELFQRLVGLDPQDCVSLCHLGCAARALGDPERALDFFHRAAEAAPWFGDPCYLMADVYRVQENDPRAVQCWWNVVQHSVAFCTRTWEWDLGEDHPDADIYEIASDALAQFSHAAEPHMTAAPLWRAVTRDDPYDPEVREELARKLLGSDDLIGAERELLSALDLCSSEKSRQPDRIYSLLLSLYERQRRQRDIALITFDRALPRPAG